MSFQQQTTDMGADWSQLHFDLLSQIANHLSTVEDLVRMSSVCRHWLGSLITSVKAIWDPSSSQIPWLMLSEPDMEASWCPTMKRTLVTSDTFWLPPALYHRQTVTSPTTATKLYDPSRNKGYSWMLPETFGRKCWGSDYGWVVTLGFDLEMHLFNPLTKARQSLPSQSAFLHQKFEEFPLSRDDLVRTLACYVQRVRVFEMPPQYVDDKDGNRNPDSSLVVMAIHGEFSWLSYAKPGDPSWIPIDESQAKELDFVADVAYCKGLLLVLRHGGSLLNVVGDGLSGSSNPLMAVDFSPSSKQSLPLELQDHFLDHCQLFESFDHDLLMVVRLKNDDNDYLVSFIDYTTVKFQVFKLDFHAKQWKEIKDMGDLTLLIDDNRCTSVRPSTIVGCNRNCIYFCEDGSWICRREDGVADRDMGIYNMDDDSILPLYQGEVMDTKLTSPFWFMPKHNSSSSYS